MCVIEEVSMTPKKWNKYVVNSDLTTKIEGGLRHLQDI